MQTGTALLIDDDDCSCCHAMANSACYQLDGPNKYWTVVTAVGRWKWVLLKEIIFTSNSEHRSSVQKRNAATIYNTFVRTFTIFNNGHHLSSSSF